MTITPKEALRLSRAEALKLKHSRRMVIRVEDGKDEAVDVFTTEQIADIIDEANAGKDAIIAALRRDAADADREATRDAQGAYEQGQQDEADRNRDNYLTHHQKGHQVSQAQDTRHMIGAQVAKAPPEFRHAYHVAYEAIFRAVQAANIAADSAGHLAIAMIGAELELEVEQDTIATEGTDSVAGSLQ